MIVKNCIVSIKGEEYLCSVNTKRFSLIITKKVGDKEIRSGMTKRVHPFYKDIYIKVPYNREFAAWK